MAERLLCAQLLRRRKAAQAHGRKRPVEVAITDKTGAAGIKHWIESRFDIEITKHDPRVVKIRNKIAAEYALDRVSSISDGEMFKWVKEAFEDDMPALR